jgi:hypothetical protein
MVDQATGRDDVASCDPSLFPAGMKGLSLRNYLPVSAGFPEMGYHVRAQDPDGLEGLFQFV